MLHIATAHFGSPDWIEIQTRYLRRHIAVPYQTWASLESIDASYGSYFDHIIDHAGRHSDKLNHLATEILGEARADDLLMFLDGDAFPIKDPMPLIAEGLARAKLVAVRRSENLEDRQPHPCFCVTTAGTWRQLCGDWSAGYCWVNSRGIRRTDVGGNLLRKLELTQTPWVEVLRTNRRNLDPLLFAIYGDTIYHHGAGFRNTLSQVHVARAPTPRPLSYLPLPWRLRRQLALEPRRAWVRRERRRQQRQSRGVMERIRRDDPNWLDDFI